MNFKNSIIFIFLTCFSSFSSAQSNQFSYQNKDLNALLQEIENKTNLTFNYDPEKLASYSFTGNLDFSKQNELLHNLFYNTPFNFEIIGQTIIILSPVLKDYKICGYLKDKKSGTTLPFANIFMTDQSQGTQSDEAGFFEFHFSAYKNSSFSISYIGYHTQTFQVQEFDSTTCPTIFLQIDSKIFGNEIVVTDYILEGIKEGAASSSIVFDYNNLSNSHPNIEHDILKTVQLIPGVTSVDESATNLQIRGGTADQNLVIWEQATLYDPGHFFGMISAINPFVVEEVKVFKGVFEPKYDNRIGGIIDMSLSDSLSQSFQGGVGTTLTEAHAFLKVPIVKNRLSILTSGRNTINTIFKSPTLSKYSAKVFQASDIELEDIDGETEQVLNYYDWNAKLLFRVSKNALFKASYFHSKNKFEYAAIILDEEIKTSDIVSFRSRAASLSLILKINNKWRSQFSFTHSAYENDYFFSLFDLDDEIFSEENQVFNNINDQTFSLTNHLDLGANLSFQVGYDFNQKEVNFNIDFSSIYEEGFEDINFIKGEFHNIFAAFQFKKNNLQINGGFRSNYYAQSDSWAFSPRLNIQYALFKNLKWKFSTGTFQQYISQLKEFGDNNLATNNRVWILSLAESEALQQANKISTGFLFKNKGWLIDLEAYYNKTKGLSALSPLFASGIDIPDFVHGDAIARGVDFLVKKRWGAYHFWVNYSLSKIDFDFPDLEARSFPATHDQRHNLSVINSYNYKNWNFSLRFQYRSGLPTSEPFNLNIEIEEETNEIFYEIEYEFLNRVRLAPYSRLDLGIRYQHHFKSPNIHAEIAFSFINLLNRENILTRDYYLSEIDEEDEEPEIISIDRIMLKRTPQLLIRFYW